MMRAEGHAVLFTVLRETLVDNLHVHGEAIKAGRRR